MKKSSADNSPVALCDCKTDSQIFIVLSYTNGKIPRLIRKFGHSYYNHCSVSLDPSFKRTYSFARLQYRAPLAGGPVLEFLERYTLLSDEPVPVAVFRLNTTEEQYLEVKKLVNGIFSDSEYLYNLFSIISQPLIGGFRTRKALTCVEFTLLILRKLGFSLNKSDRRATPDDIADMLSEHLIYRGDIRNIMELSSDRESCNHFFAPLDRHMVGKELKAVYKLSGRFFKDRFARKNTV